MGWNRTGRNCVNSVAWASSPHRGSLTPWPCPAQPPTPTWSQKNSLRGLPGKQASGAAGGGTRGWKADYMSPHINHSGNFPHPPREERINCNPEGKPTAVITLKRKEATSFPAMNLSERLIGHDLLTCEIHLLPFGEHLVAAHTSGTGGVVVLPSCLWKSGYGAKHQN